VHATYYFDAATYLLVRVEMQGSHTTYSEYRDVGGFKLPFKTTSEWGDSKMETTLREVVINGPIEDARFIEPNVKDGVLTFNSLASRKTGDPESVKADAPKPTTGNNETVASETMPNSARVTEVNFPNFTACTIPELQQTVPELQGLKPAPDQQQLSALLDKVGAKTVEIARSTPNLISRETVTELRKPPAVMQYDYLILNRIQGKAVFLDEFRVDLKTGDKFQTDEDLKDASSARAAVERASRDLAASQFGRRPISQGFALRGSTSIPSIVGKPSSVISGNRKWMAIAHWFSRLHKSRNRSPLRRYLCLKARMFPCSFKAWLGWTPLIFTFGACEPICLHHCPMFYCTV